MDETSIRVDPEAIAIHSFLERSGVGDPDTNRPLTAPMVFGLGGGIGMMLFVFEYQGHDPTVGLITRYHTKSGGYTGFSDAALSRCAGASSIRQSSSSKVAERTLRDAVLRNGRALCWIDRSAIPEQFLPAIFSQLAPWLVVVTDVDGDRVRFQDPALGEIETDLPSFKSAWGGFRPLKHRLVTIELERAPLDLLEQTREAIKATCANMLQPEMSNFGLPALASWAESLINTRHKRGWPILFSTASRHVSAMSSVYLAIATGGSSNRPAYAAFLRAVSALHPDSVLERATDAFDTSAHLWAKLANVALPDQQPFLSTVRNAIDGRFALEQSFRRGIPITANEHQDNRDELDRLLTSQDVDAGDVITRYRDMAEIVSEIEAIERSAIKTLSDWSSEHKGTG